MKKKKADLILCADLHIREDQPICRTDDYELAQDRKIDFLLKLQDKHNCNILCAGDLFNKAKSSKSLEIYMMNKLVDNNNDFFVIPGNHDLPNHNIDNINDSSIGILHNAFMLRLEECKLDTIHPAYISKKIGMIHSLIHRNKPYKADGKIISTKAIKILKDNPEYDLILSGDNHKTFGEEYKGRLLVNPGSMMRMTADQVDHRPCVFLYYSESNTVEQIFFPIEQDVISREHIDLKDKNDERMESFIKKMGNDVELSLDFKNNIHAYIKGNKIKSKTEEIIWGCVE
jgi:DNA repair exonuclease SbcCD nuclease subunit